MNWWGDVSEDVDAVVGVDAVGRGVVCWWWHDDRSCRL